MRHERMGNGPENGNNGISNADLAEKLRGEAAKISNFQRPEKSRESHVGGKDTKTGFGKGDLNMDYVNALAGVRDKAERGETVEEYAEYFTRKEREAAEGGFESKGYAAGILANSPEIRVEKLDTLVRDINGKIIKDKSVDEETIQTFQTEVRNIIDGNDEESEDQAS